jgi:hypothetical protein
LSPLDDLATLLSLPKLAHYALDWTELEGAVGLRFPTEYKRFVETFPPGLLRGSLFVFHPEQRRPAFEGLFDMVGRSYQGLVDLDDSPPGSPPFPFGFYPTQGGLVPWADFDTKVVLFWNPTGVDPDHWPIVACNTSLDYEEMSGTTAQCLYEVVAGNAPWSVFPDYFWDAEPGFRPLNAPQSN